MDAPGNSLTDRDVLVIDCQTTGATPRSGRLLEVGWAVAKPSTGRPASPETYLIRSSDDEDLSPIIDKLTGIRPDEMAGARGPLRVWQRLARTAREIGQRSGLPCLAAIHYARFELAFLHTWHAESAPGTPFPFETICTHQLARRLFPGLPRCGLRALAGYFGMGMPAEKRCAPHVAATELIWGQLVVRLEAEGITSFADLKQWMKTTPRPARQLRVYPMPPSLLSRVPDRPGVYRFRRVNGDALYVGKAKSLKNRVGTYFQPRRRHPEHILEMLTQAVDLDCAPTATALEAALQEAEDIHRLAPDYNIQLQIGDRPPVFSSHDFQLMEASVDTSLPMGPFPSQQALQPMASLVKYLSCPPTPQTGDAECLTRKFNRPRDLMPSMDVFSEGLALFSRLNDLPDEPTPLARRLLMRGAYWWRVAQEAVEKPDTQGDAEDSSEAIWTLEDVVAFCESVACRGAFLVRRGQWFKLLSEATLAWETPHRGETLRMVAIRSGQVTPLSSPSCWDAVSSPRGHRLAPIQHRACFDGAVYTRMRVLTTEIRRLVAEGRRVKIYLRPGVNLDQSALARLFSLI